MKRFLLFLFLCLSFPAYAIDMPGSLKTFLKSKYPSIIFKIDNSFVVKNEMFLPLILTTDKDIKPPLSGKIEIIYDVPDKTNKDLPRLIWFSNNWVYIKLIKQNDGSQTILDLNEINSEYKQRFLKTRFPGDLVIPKGLTLKENISDIAGELPIKILKQEKKLPLSGLLYLTSPDTGKIIYLELNDLSMIHEIQTMGAPWEISFNKEGKTLYVTDFAKDKIYELKPNDSSILKTIELSSMSSPVDIKVSNDGSLAYVLEALSSDFAVYQTIDSKLFSKTKLPPNPNSFAFLNKAMLIAVTSPSTNTLTFLSLENFAHKHQLMISGSPEKILSDTLGKNLYVANRSGNSVSVIDTTTMKITNTIEVGEAPTSLALSKDSKWLYVTSGKSNTISIIDTEISMVTDTISLPIETQFPGDIELSGDNMWLFVTSETTGTISVIDLTLKNIALKLDVGVPTHTALLVDRESEGINDKGY